MLYSPEPINIGIPGLYSKTNRSQGMVKMIFRIGILLIWIMALLVGLPDVSMANESPGIVVWKLQANKGVDVADVNLISNFVANQVAKYSGSKVISEADIYTILKGEQTRQQCGAEDTSCVAEIGAALGVPEAVSGDIGKIGDFWMLNLRRINISSAEVIGRSSRNIEGSVNDLIRSLPGAVAELFGLQAGEKPKAIEAPTTGTLSITSQPEGATVSINGRRIGDAPLKKELKIDSYKLKVKRRGYKPLEQEVRILPGETTELAFELERIPPGRLAVDSEPAGASLFLDGDPKGETPFKRKVDVGEYNLELKLDGYNTAKKSVTVKSKETTRLNLTLERDYPMNPYKKYGYVTFFTGVGLVAFGGLATGMSSMKADDYNKATTSGGMEDAKIAGESWMGAAYAGYAIGGALMVTGVVLWALSPGDQKWWEDHQLSAGPTSDGSGGVVSLGGRW